MSISPSKLVRALSDETRLRILTLLFKWGELCVCELSISLELSQPKISRHLAILREHKLLKDRREGQWIYYRLHPEIPAWSLRALAALVEGAEDRSPFKGDDARLAVMQGQSAAACKPV
jgi:ArsR family transcriptional regulator